MPDALPPTLAERLDAARAALPPADHAAIAAVVRDVLATLHGDLTAAEISLFGEVEELGRTIATAKSEIAALQVEDINGTHIPSATDELDAIVAHTAAATHAILEACETLDRIAEGPLAEDAAAAAAQQAATTRIYEACSFQDITGQRISKVVAALKAIEGKVAAMLSTFAARRPLDAAPRDPPAPAPAAVDTLTNGPQLPAVAMDQSDIDRLLASFD